MYKEIQFSGYKLFSEEKLMELNEISNLNIIIGKNSSGKSSLLDVIEMVYDCENFKKAKKDIGIINFKIPMPNKIADIIFSNYSSLGGWSKSTYMQKVDGKMAYIELGGTQNAKSNSYRVLNTDDIPLSDQYIFRSNLEELLKEQRGKYAFRRLSAERNILPEKEMEINLSNTGEGASNLVRAYLNYSTSDESVIEENLLNELNQIMYPEAEFENIRIQQVTEANDSLWEIFLKERGRDRVPLSKSGSGVKTIILVLLNLMVIPRLKEYKNKKIIYGFEELENNLHPALQRKIFDYIYEYAVEHDAYVFLTTHSHIAINAFYDKEKATIYHIVKEGKHSNIKRIESYLDKTEILDDLDVRASDLLQSNGIIWVEGPSDRIYIKKWLDVFCDNQYEEGKHFQFLYYGGRLLSQYSAQEETDLINIITTNRNAAIVMDSDKRYQGESVNSTKMRIRDEFNRLGMFSWITKGKEIENYIPKEAIEEMLKTKIKKQCGKYELFPDYIAPLYRNFTGKKVPFANEVKEYITRENSLNILDLKSQIVKLYKEIKKWNPEQI